MFRSDYAVLVHANNFCLGILVFAQVTGFDLVSLLTHDDRWENLLFFGYVASSLSITTAAYARRLWTSGRADSWAVGTATCLLLVVPALVGMKERNWDGVSEVLRFYGAPVAFAGSLMLTASIWTMMFRTQRKATDLGRPGIAALLPRALGSAILAAAVYVTARGIVEQVLVQLMCSWFGFVLFPFYAAMAFMVLRLPRPR